MKIIVPDYYGEFKCIASECRHNCCIGWEIDIDKDTAEYYKSVDGAVGEKLRENISYENCPHFVLGDHERCPFLDGNNLCEIISTLGEDALCQICDDHPRYRSIYSDREEIGVGLSCEAAAKLIVGKKDITRLIELSDDGIFEEADSTEKEFFALRENIFSILQNRALPITERLTEMLIFCNVTVSEIDIRSYIPTYLNLEVLDRKWHETLQEIHETEFDTTLSSEFDTAFEQIAIYFIFRHLSTILDWSDLANTAFFCALSTKMIMSVCAYHKHITGNLTSDNIAEICRIYSSEIEYSVENTETLLTLDI